jgi:hypothetical protein
MTNILFIAWRAGGPSAGHWGPVGLLEHGAGRYRFVYTEGARSLGAFRPFSGMDDLEAVYESESLFPVFANRLLNSSRPEYEAFLAWGGFDPNDPPDPLALLGVTEGLRQTDSFEVFPCPQPDVDGCYVNKFFLHGIRWMPLAAQERIARLESGERLALLLDVANEHDPCAVAVRTWSAPEMFIVGYVPRYLARDVWELYVQCVPTPPDLQVERINRDAPLQNRVLCRMSACWPEGFRPCSSEQFQPIVGPLPSLQSMGRACG